jgi:hypothetical protein
MDEDFGYHNLTQEETAKQAKKDGSNEEDKEDEKKKHVQSSNFEK